MTGKTYTYSSENLLKTATGGVALAYDPMLRLYDITGGSTLRFAYDGLDMIAEYDASNALQRRYVHGPGMDEPLVQYEGAGITSRIWLHADERGSIIANSVGGGGMLNINTYDDYGKPQAANSSRFQFTGQVWLPQIDAYYYKARIYSPTLGRFLQPDPIGYESGANLYAYVLNDPVNWTDPWGLDRREQATIVTCKIDDLCVTGQLPFRNTSVEYGSSYATGATAVGNEQGGGTGEIVVVGIRKPKPGHKYRSLRKVSAEKCSLTTAEDALLTQHFATPFAPGRQAGNGEVTLWGGNPIQQSIENRGQAVVNVTLSGHVLHSPWGGGRVVRSVIIGEDGAAYSSTVGSGTNSSKFWSGINQYAGPAIFAINDMAMADFIAKSGICR